MQQIASSIIVLAGAICVAMPLTIHPITATADRAMTLGWVLVAGGVFCFTFDSVRERRKRNVKED